MAKYHARWSINGQQQMKVMAMEDTLGDHLLLGTTDSTERATQRLLGLLETPAYMRRAHAVHYAVDECLRTCARQRADWFEGVRLHLRSWNRLINSAPHHLGLVPADEREKLLTIDTAVFQPEERRLALGRPGRPATIWRDLARAIERFNTRWLDFIQVFDATAVNNLIQSYNQHYLLEKECVFRSPKLAARGFQPWEPITVDLLLREFPLLPILVFRF